MGPPELGHIEALAEILTLRVIGSTGGGILALAVVRPRSWIGFWQRLAVSLLAGLMLEPALRGYLNWPATPDNIIASACIVSASSWWVVHAWIRLIQARAGRE